MTLPGSRIHSASIDLSAIRENAAVLVRRAASRIVVADVRADAYGHGLAAVIDAAVDGGACARDIDSAASLDHDADLVSAGSALYGLSADLELQPAMRVSALVVGTKTIDAGESVSYGYTWTAISRSRESATPMAWIASRATEDPSDSVERRVASWGAWR